MWQKAVRETDVGILIRVEVSPGSAKDGWAGYDEWREAVKVKLKARPRRGKANDALMEFVAAALGVPAGAVRIMAGARSRIKEVAVSSIDVASAVARLSGVLER